MARAGQPVAFELVATDPDSGVRDDCGSPVVAFGDEDGGVAVCEVACLSLPAGPGRLRRSFDHVYAESGTYAATSTLVGCGSDAAADVSVDLPVTVTT